jgi:transcriptional regulator with XRE-family HTH domain
MEKSKMNPAKFADYTKINATTVNHILSGRNKKPSIDVIMQILKAYPDINSEWLLFGKEPMNKGEKTMLEPQKPPVLQNMFDAIPDKLSKDSVNPHSTTNISKYSKEMRDKHDEFTTQNIKNQSHIGEISISENIDKIIIFFKNKTFITLRPEE